MKIRGLGYLHSQDAGKHLYEVIEEESYEKKSIQWIKIEKGTYGENVIRIP